MAGGIGSRLWPLSRKSYPKQFHDLLGCGRTLLQQTFDRYSRIVPLKNIIVSTNSAYSDLVREQLPALSSEQILHEPTYRGTAPSIAYAACHISVSTKMPTLLLLRPTSLSSTRTFL